MKILCVLFLGGVFVRVLVKSLATANYLSFSLCWFYSSSPMVDVIIKM